MNRIFCVGNRLVVEDRAGPAVYDRLRRLPPVGNLPVLEVRVVGLEAPTPAGAVARAATPAAEPAATGVG